MDDVEFWMEVVLIPFVGIFGIIVNMIAIYILTRPDMKSSINHILLGKFITGVAQSRDDSRTGYEGF